MTFGQDRFSEGQLVKALHGMFVLLLGAYLLLNLAAGSGGKLLAGLMVYAVAVAALLHLGRDRPYLVRVANLAAVLLVTFLTRQYGADSGINGLVVLPLLATALSQSTAQTLGLALLALFSQWLVVPDWAARLVLLRFYLPGLAALAILMIQRNNVSRLRERVVKLEVLDPMTGAHNIRAFNNLLGRTHLLARRHGFPYSVVAIDMAGLAEINRRYGRQAGNNCLQTLGETLAGTTRSSDVLGRAGGGEFLLLLPYADRKAAGVAAQRLRELISRTRQKVKGGELALAAHIGYASCPEDEQDPQNLVDHADRQLEMDRNLRHKSKPTWV